MLDQKKSRIKRLSIWFVLNLIIFTLCYLNYRFQLKHRYLYRTLSAGLCFSRAAAMVINFNLILVWIPMCKYTLTRLAYVANISASRQRKRLQQMAKHPPAGHGSQQRQHTIASSHSDCGPPSATNPTNFDDQADSLIKHLLSKLKSSLQQADWKIRYWFCVTKLNYTNSFLIAVDHCTSLHTICATTITIASIIHTVAHLMNVINFSKNFDPLLTNLNMAEYRGQNPLHLLVSVPGITGCFMIIILLLMSLSSIDIIRNQSFDLFQVFHRLSIVFVFLLILHPSSHVLKEQSNVDRYNPEICHLPNSTGQSQPVVSQQHERTLGSNNSPVIKFSDSPANLTRASNTTARAKFSAHAEAPSGEQLNSAPKVVARHSTRSSHSLTDLLLASGTTVDSTTIVNKENKRGNNKEIGEKPLPDRGQNGTTANSGQLNDKIIYTKWRASGSNGVAPSEEATQFATRTNDDNHRREESTQSDLETTTATASRRQTNINDEKYLIRIKVNKTIDSQQGAGDELTQQVRTRSPSGGFLSFNNSERQDALRHYYKEYDATERDDLLLPLSASTSSWTTADSSGTNENAGRFSPCLDQKPLFVAQSTICWYVLSVGLSCYLFDLLLRRLRRSKSTIELLDFRSDCEGNLIELILSNNHKRFAHWLPGQFVYLNCPQIATHEWHPFTISSMDNRTRQFTLHIKTGGDWTRKLRGELEQLTAAANNSGQTLPIDSANSHSQLLRKLYQGYVTYNENKMFSGHNINGKTDCCLPAIALGSSSAVPKPSVISFGHQHARLHTADGGANLADVHCHVASSDCYDSRTGQLQIVCKSLNRIPITLHQKHDDFFSGIDGVGEKSYLDLNREGTVRQDCALYPTISAVNSNLSCHDDRNESSGKFEKNCLQPIGSFDSRGNLDLFIDGPFHSPFERLLEQQVSVCIANGVGWTAFSSVFQCITNNIYATTVNSNNDWWSKWHNYVSSTSRHQRGGSGRSCKPDQRVVSVERDIHSNLHLMIIVATIEQLKPFYHIALRYFEFILKHCQTNASSTGRSQLNPVREVRAFITRSNLKDPDVREFCQKENLNPQVAGDGLTVNGFFSIHFGKPSLELYLKTFESAYSNRQKISVYCCGSYHVKRTVQGICQDLNKTIRSRRQVGPIYLYHEENF